MFHYTQMLTQRSISFVVIGIAAAFVSSCVSFSDRSNPLVLGKPYIIEAGQTLLYFDSVGVPRKKILCQESVGIVYEARDTLFVDFSAEALPNPDNDERSLDKQDCENTFIAHSDPPRRFGDAYSEGEWFRYRYMSFDVDLMVMPFKFRFPQAGLPGTFVANSNVGAYMGIRYDFSRHRYIYFRNATTMEQSSSSIGIGVFGGLDPVLITPFNTQNQVPIEYDALGVNYGVAIIAGYGAVTFGLALGLETLLDDNARYWIFNHKPLVGFVIGLNLN